MIDELITRIRLRAYNPETCTDSPQFHSREPFPPVSSEELAQAEGGLGFSLVPFLGEVYCRIGNGGFGPGFGLIGLPGGYLSSHGKSLVEMYEWYHEPNREDLNWQWPDNVVPICDWGCTIVTCVNCNTGSIMTFDPGARGEGGPMNLAFGQSHPSVAAWFEDWVNDVQLWDKMYERDPTRDRTGINPFTGKEIVRLGTRLRR